MTFVFVFFIVCAAAQINHQVKNTRQCKAGGGMCKQTCVGNDVDTGPCCRNSYRCCQPCDDTQQCTAGGGMCKQKCVDDEEDTGPCCRNSYRCCQPCNVTCGGIFNEPSGTLTSQNYPSNYCNNHDCNYNIIVDDGFKIMLNFTFFHTEKIYYFGRFYDFVKMILLYNIHKVEIILERS
ncbi:CUBN [Mytilus edulis]|uniref:CUBN n=1 Tax=Mytilus edulis TaxID=6550 RepID=A0A8S3TEE7_MYTED|nr:CUBN [Mytilus edulis]